MQSYGVFDVDQQIKLGVLEANFMEPAHDKQDFERTPILQRLETRLKQMSIEYWCVTYLSIMINYKFALLYEYCFNMCKMDNWS